MHTDVKDELDALREQVGRLERREARRARIARAAWLVGLVVVLAWAGTAVADPPAPLACDRTEHDFLYCFGRGTPAAPQIDSNFEALADLVDTNITAMTSRIDGLLAPGSITSAHVADGAIAPADLVAGGCPAGYLVRATAAGTFECARAFRTFTNTYTASVNGGDGSGADRARLPMIPTSAGACFLTQVTIDDAETFGELPTCQVLDVGGTWTLEASVADVGGPSVYEDARATCVAICLQL